MTTAKTQDTAEALGRILSTIIADILVLCLRAWLLSLCVAFFVPGIALSFWHWLLISFTVRLFLLKSDKRV